MAYLTGVGAHSVRGASEERRGGVSSHHHCISRLQLTFLSIKLTILSLKLTFLSLAYNPFSAGCIGQQRDIYTYIYTLCINIPLAHRRPALRAHQQIALRVQQIARPHPLLPRETRPFNTCDLPLSYSALCIPFKLSTYP